MTAALGAPVSITLHAHNDRVFCSNGTTLYEAAPGTAPDPAVDNFATGATWPIGNGDGDSITGLGSLGRDLYIFKGRSIWLMTGYTKEERQTRQYSKVNGTIATDSVRAANLEGVGECVIFLDSSKRLMAVTVNGIIDFGDTVQSKLNEIYEGALTPFPLQHNCRAIVDPDGNYILAINKTSSPGPEYS